MKPKTITLSNSLAIATIVAALTASSLWGQALPGRAYERYPLNPVDEASQDPELVRFRERLLQALRTRDVEAVVAAADPAERAAVRTGFTWGTPESPDWASLMKLLSLGGSFTTTRGKVQGRREFCAPYTYSVYPKPAPQRLLSRATNELDPWVIISDQVPLRSRPDPDAPVLTRLSYELVEVDGTSQEYRSSPVLWYGVFAGSQQGWVSGDQIRNPEDSHACFAKIDGQWFLAEFDRGYTR